LIATDALLVARTHSGSPSRHACGGQPKPGPERSEG